jgi:hypothetical protein
MDQGGGGILEIDPSVDFQEKDVARLNIEKVVEIIFEREFATSCIVETGL